MQPRRWRVTAALLLALGLTAGLYLATLNTPPTPPSTRPTLHQLHQLADLLTLRVPVSDVQVSRIAGYTGGIELVLLVHGHAHLGTDLARGRFTGVDTDARRATLELPMPEVRQASLDHASTRVYRIDCQGLWHIVPGQAGEVALVNRALERAQQVVAEVTADNELKQRACKHAEQVIHPFFGEVGWEIEIHWFQAD